MLRTPGRTRMAAAVAAMLFGLSLAGCTAPSATPADPRGTRQADVVDLQPILDAVAAADSRVVDPTARVYYSGAAQTLAVMPLISGDDPVTTPTLTDILIAVHDHTPDDIATVTVIARDTSADQRLIDLRPAIDGLPDGVTVLWDGGATIARVDLDKL